MSRVSSLIPHPSSLALRRGRTLDLTGAIPLVMGIINVTPDSFSDGGVHGDCALAVEGALRMIEEGAAILDVGGESTRPGAEPVSIGEEINRVVPVIERVRRESDVAISVDTRNAAVARAAIDAGADIVNDVTALRHDPAMKTAVAEAGVPAILMHMRGNPKTMQSLTDYGDVVADVANELGAARDAATAAGVTQVLVDPGIGFAKTFEQNLEILARCEKFRELGPFVIGASRKKFIGHLTGREAGSDRLSGSLAAVASAARGGASIVRVHDVKETVEFLSVYGAIEERRR